MSVRANSSQHSLGNAESVSHTSSSRTVVEPAPDKPMSVRNLDAPRWRSPVDSRLFRQVPTVEFHCPFTGLAQRPVVTRRLMDPGQDQPQRAPPAAGPG
jgi:hypothetical protein